MRRIKTVTLDNVSIDIAALNLGEIESFLRVQREALGLDPDTGKEAAGKQADPEKMTDVWRNFICTGLNGTLEAAEAGTKKWDANRLVAEIDLLFFEKLRKELLTFSGLKAEEEKKTELSAAEPQAAAVAAS